MKFELNVDELAILMGPLRESQSDALRMHGEIAKLEVRLAQATSQVSEGQTPNGHLVKVLTNVCAELAAGRKIGAIKLVREATGLGLKEAKDVVEGNFHPNGVSYNRF